MKEFNSKLYLDFIPHNIKEDVSYHDRITVRAILLDEHNFICLHQIKRGDIFGKLTYLETPGGGKEKEESLEDGLRREILEELGYTIEILAYLGEVKDTYDLIKQRNDVHFFLAKIKEDTHHLHRVSRGDSLIEKSLRLPLKEVIKRYENYEDQPLLNVVKRRELPFFKNLVDKLDILV